MIATECVPDVSMAGLMRSDYRLLAVASLSAVLLGSVSSRAAAITVQEVPNPRNGGGWVSDRANIISSETEVKLNQRLTQLEAESGQEMAIVTVEDTSGFASPKAFATDLFNHWGVGKAAEDNGVLFLVSVGDRRSEVEVGYGLESVLTQSKVERLLTREAIPEFKQGRFDAGIEKASMALVSELDRAGLGSAETDSLAIAPQPSTTAQAPETVRGGSPFSSYSNGIKLLVLGSGAVAILFYRYGRSAFLEPLALAPGSNQTFNIGTDPQYLRTRLVNAVPVGIGGFGLGGTVAMLMGIGFPLVGGFVMGLPLAVVAYFFQPTGKGKKGSRTLFVCDRCDVPLVEAEREETLAQLSKPQRVAAQIGSTSYAGWKCSICKEISVRGVHTHAGYERCPRCQERTVEAHSDRTPATYHHSGEVRTHRFCHCCDYTDDTVKHLPRLTHTHHHTSHSAGHSSGGFGGSSGGSFGGGGGFGGGSSGGGGGGASW